MNQTFKKNTVSPESSALNSAGHTLATTEDNKGVIDIRLTADQDILLQRLVSEIESKFGNLNVELATIRVKFQLLKDILNSGAPK